MTEQASFRRIYGPAPILAVITLGGLLAALFGDGVWDEISWVALAVPLTVILWKLCIAQKSG